MENTRCLRIATLSFLLLAIHIASGSFNGTVRGQTSPPRLAGTQYEGPINPLPPSPASAYSVRLLHTFYIFEERGRVICRFTITALGHDQTEFKYNPETRRKENVRVNVPAENTSTDEIGTYKQIGNTIQLEFPDRYVEATPKVEGSLKGLAGTTTFKRSNRKEQFIVVLKDGQVSRSNNEPSNSETGEGNGVTGLGDVVVPGDAEPKRTTENPGISFEGPNLDIGDDGTYRPPSGYRWIDPTNPNDLRIQLMRGLIRAADGHSLPAKGYRWANPKDPKDFRVERIP